MQLEHKASVYQESIGSLRDLRQNKLSSHVNHATCSNTNNRKLYMNIFYNCVKSRNSKISSLILSSLRTVDVKACQRIFNCNIQYSLDETCWYLLTCT